MQKRLYRSRNDRVLAGVCGGLGAYIGIDPTVVRVIAAVLLLMSFGTMVLIYLAWVLIVPLEPMQQPAVRPDTEVIRK